MDKVLSKRRMAKNTLLLYCQLFITVLIQLYTVPIVLDCLGIQDYGIYQVVGGFVTMFSFLKSTLVSGSQRFISFALGQGDDAVVKKVFNMTITVFIFFTFLIFALLEIFGSWFVNSQMNFPEESHVAVNVVFQLSLFGFIVDLLATPYNSAIVAHERINVFAIMGIFESFCKLGIAIILKYILYDRLIAYAILLFSLSLIMRIGYQFYCQRNFAECKSYRFYWDKSLFRDLTSYAGWNIFGSVANILRVQGINILMNLFYGPILNAAHSIASQVSGFLKHLIESVYLSTRPQIVKLYSQGSEEAMWNLVYQSSKLTFFLILFLSIPVVIETDTILQLWLKEVPPYSAVMIRLMLFSLLIETLSNQIIGSLQAANRIRRYQIYSSTILILVVPLSYIVLSVYPVSPVIPYIIMAILSGFYVVSILIVAKSDVNLNLSLYSKQIIMRSAISALLIFCISNFIIHNFPPSILRILLTIIIVSLISVLVIWIIGLNQAERTFITGIIKKKILNKSL